MPAFSRPIYLNSKSVDLPVKYSARGNMDFWMGRCAFLSLVHWKDSIRRRGPEDCQLHSRLPSSVAKATSILYKCGLSKCDAGIITCISITWNSLEMQIPEAQLNPPWTRRSGVDPSTLFNKPSRWFWYTQFENFLPILPPAGEEENLLLPF